MITGPDVSPAAANCLCMAVISSGLLYLHMPDMKYLIKQYYRNNRRIGIRESYGQRHTDIDTDRTTQGQIQIQIHTHTHRGREMGGGRKGGRERETESERERERDTHTHREYVQLDAFDITMQFCKTIVDKVFRFHRATRTDRARGLECIDHCQEKSKKICQ